MFDLLLEINLEKGKKSQSGIAISNRIVPVLHEINNQFCGLILRSVVTLLKAHFSLLQIR